MPNSAGSRLRWQLSVVELRKYLAAEDLPWRHKLVLACDQMCAQLLASTGWLCASGGHRRSERHLALTLSCGGGAAGMVAATVVTILRWCAPWEFL